MIPVWDSNHINSLHAFALDVAAGLKRAFVDCCGIWHFFANIYKRHSLLKSSSLPEFPELFIDPEE